jgi:hypothetical protein
MTCEKCGEHVTVGEWPFCPHGVPNVGIGVVDDTIIGGRWCETLGHEPVFYGSKSELRRLAAERGLTNVVKHDDAYYAKQRKMHDERIRDEKQVRA